MKICSIEGCPERHRAKGFCAGHYARSKRGLPMVPVIPKRHGSLEQRLWSKVNKDTGSDCWEWTGCLNPAGYAWMHNTEGTSFAHRIAWELEHNVSLKSSDEIDHLCHNTKCVNPSHLRVTDRWGNTQNLTGKRANNTSGHRNVYWREGKRRWMVSVTSFGKRHSGGYFKDKEEAIEVARKLRARVLAPVPEIKP